MTIPKISLRCILNISFLELQTGQTSLVEGGQFLRSYIPVDSQYGFLVFISGFTTAVMPFNEFFFLFDSHSHGNRGLRIQGGTSVLLSFKILLKSRSISR